MPKDLSASTSGKNTTNTINSTKKHPRKASKSVDLFTLFSTPHNPVKAENALWLAVITQAVIDALSKSAKSEDSFHKEAAIRWLTGGGRDFVDVCLNAGLDPAYMRRQAKKAILHPAAWRAAPGQGVRYLERRAYRLLHENPKKKPANPAHVDVAFIPHPAAQSSLLETL